MAVNEMTSKGYITDVKSIMLSPLRVKFDISTLNMIISFIYKPSVLRTRKTMSNFLKLFTNLDMSIYNDNPGLVARIWLIKTSLEARLKEGMDSDESVQVYVIDQPECTDFEKDILEDIVKNRPVSHEESRYLVKKLDDALAYGYTATVKDTFQDILDHISDGDFKSYKSVQDSLYNLATSIINIKRNIGSLDSDQTFTLDEEQFDMVLQEACEKLRDRNRIFITGIQGLNILLSPGYMSKRLYVYLAFPGMGKSTMLLKSALDIKKYNKGIQTKDPDKRPAVLLLIMENDIAETIERIFNMVGSNDDIRNYSWKAVKKILRDTGHLKITNDDNIDIIIKEYRNREIDTNDLYSITNDLADEGIEVITLILDYMKRIRPAEHAPDEKTELKNITNELKEYAKFFDVPVITAQQLNRSGAAVIDAALQNNKEDVTRLVGRDSIAGAWEIQENADMTIIINPEIRADDGVKFLTFKMLKRRYRSTEKSEKKRRMDYFNQPFEDGNDIRLMDDVDLPEPLYLDSLATTFLPDESEDVKNEKTATDRVEKPSKKKSSFMTELDPLEFQAFDISSSDNT